MTTAAHLPTVIASWNALREHQPAHARIDQIDLVVVRIEGAPHVLYGRCTHRNALLAQGRVEGDRLVCALHGWDYACADGRSNVGDDEGIPRFAAWVEGDDVLVDAEEIRRWRARTPVDFLEDELDP